MYGRQNPNLDKPFQVVDFNTFKKKNHSKIISSRNTKIIFNPSQQQITIPIILAIYELSSSNQINPDVFAGFNFDQAPKQFLTCTHQKTMKTLLQTIISNADSQKTLISLLDDFPVIGFVLDAYCRAVCLNFMKGKKDLFLYGNEQQVLQNFAFQPRGDLLNTMVDALSMNLNLTVGEIVQNYGSEGNKKKVRIKFGGQEAEAQLLGGKRKQNGGYNIKINEHSGTKNLKQLHSLETEASESNQASLLESNSSQVKDSAPEVVKKAASLYTTPKTNNNPRSPVPGANSSVFGILNHSKCTCHKLICVCRR